MEPKWATCQQQWTSPSITTELMDRCRQTMAHGINKWISVVITMKFHGKCLRWGRRTKLITWLKEKRLRWRNIESSSTNTLSMEWKRRAWRKDLWPSSAPIPKTVTADTTLKCVASVPFSPIERAVNKIQCSDAWTTDLHRLTSRWRWMTSPFKCSAQMLQTLPCTWPQPSLLRWSQWSSWLSTDLSVWYWQEYI